MIPFDDWMKQARKEAAQRGLHIPETMEDAEEFEWKNQWQNEMEPAEAVFYMLQNQKEGEVTSGKKPTVI